MSAQTRLLFSVEAHLQRPDGKGWKENVQWPGTSLTTRGPPVL